MAFDILPPEFLFPTKYVLSDRGIRKALRNGDIEAEDLSDEQIQSATLDVRIGQTIVYDEEAIAQTQRYQNSLSFKAQLDSELTQAFGKVFFDVKDREIDLPPRCFAEIHLHEKIKSKYLFVPDLRSGRGRLLLEISNQSINPSVLPIWNNNANTIRLYCRDRFAQLFFHTEREIDGHIVTDTDEAESIAKSLGLNTLGPYVIFYLGDQITRFKNVGIVDSRRQDERNHEKITLENLSVALTPNEAIIARLEPIVHLPGDIGIKMLHNIPYAQKSGRFRPDPEYFNLEPRRAFATWIDPGYKGPITAHLMNKKHTLELTRGTPIALGVLIKYNQQVKRSYGSAGLGSHYINHRDDRPRS